MVASSKWFPNQLQANRKTYLVPAGIESQAGQPDWLEMVKGQPDT